MTASYIFMRGLIMKISSHGVSCSTDKPSVTHYIRITTQLPKNVLKLTGETAMPNARSWEYWKWDMLYNCPISSNTHTNSTVSFPVFSN